MVGAGPAGLMAAETMAREGLSVTVFDRMPSPARKLLIAGRGGLNLTHSEPLPAFLARYGGGEAAERLRPAVEGFPPEALVAWCEELEQPTFVGSSGRVFPRAMKASPLLRAWLSRLAALGVSLRPRHEWLGWDEDGAALRFRAPGGAAPFRPAAVVLALGGASWPRLGSDGAWPALLPEVEVSPFRPANCGFRCVWSDTFRQRFEGAPLKRIALEFGGRRQWGEAVVAATGIEGGAVYAVSAPLRDAIAAEGAATALLDLRPDLDADALARRLDGPRGSVSLSNHLRRAGLPPVAVGLVQEALHRGDPAPPLSRLVKALPLRLTATEPIAGAISSAGGLRWGELDARFMLRARPGVFAAGEMLDWEAPTGGYLLQACFSTGAAAGRGVVEWLRETAAGNADRPPSRAR